MDKFDFIDCLQNTGNNYGLAGYNSKLNFTIFLKP